eukprot:313141-Amorphochlora_amoeboformis.AAC.1
MEEEKSTPEKATKEEKTQPALFSPRTKDKSKATLALLKKIRRRNTDANGILPVSYTHLTLPTKRIV